jgi:hypothetical protein
MFILCFCFPCQSEGRQVDRAQSASVESIPEVLEDRDSVTEQSDSASIHDMDYVNPRGVRFTPQQTQRDGEDGEPSYLHYQPAFSLGFTVPQPVPFYISPSVSPCLMSVHMSQHVSTYSAFGKYSDPLTFSIFCYVTALFLNGLNSFFPP